MSFPWRDLGLHLIHGSLGSPETTPQQQLDGFSCSGGLISVTNRHTNTQTDIHAHVDHNISVAIGCILAFCAYDAA